MKVWITKYALTSGIFAAEVEEPNSAFPDAVYRRGDLSKGMFRQDFHGEGIEWHRTPEGALARAEKMRAAKIASLRKQIAKLEKLTFEVKA